MSRYDLWKTTPPEPCERCDDLLECECEDDGPDPDDLRDELYERGWDDE